MADDWIKVRKKLATDGRLLIVVRRLGVTDVSRSDRDMTVTVLGALVTLWSLADDHADENGTLIGYSAADINALVGVENFAESLPSEWIDLTGEYVALPEYQAHNGSTAKARAQSAKRKKRSRSKRDTPVTVASRSKRDTSVTREEKRREEKNTISLTHARKSSGLITPIGHDVAQWLADHMQRHLGIARINREAMARMERDATDWIGNGGIDTKLAEDVMTFLAGEGGAAFPDVDSVTALGWKWGKLVKAMRAATAPAADTAPMSAAQRRMAELEAEDSAEGGDGDGR